MSNTLLNASKQRHLSTAFSKSIAKHVERLGPKMTDVRDFNQINCSKSECFPTAKNISKQLPQCGMT
jgi:hypothetical protein